MEAIKEKTLEEIKDESLETSKGLSPIEAKIEEIKEEIKSLEDKYNNINVRNFNALDIIDLKVEIVNQFEKIKTLLTEKLSLSKESATDVQREAEIDKDIVSIQKYIETVNTSIIKKEADLIAGIVVENPIIDDGADVNPIENKVEVAKITWLDLKEPMTHDDAIKELARLSAEKNGEVEYRLAEFSELKEAYEKNISGFKSETYLSNTVHPIYTNSYAGFNFADGTMDTIHKTRSVAVRCIEHKK